jgi:hypothetical protein
MEVGGAQLLGTARDCAFHQVGIIAGAAVDRQQVVDPGQYQGRRVLGQDATDPVIYLLEVAQDVGLGIVRAHAVPMKDRRAAIGAGACARMPLQLALGIIPPQGISQALGHVHQIHYRHAVAAALEQADLVLAEGQHIEMAIPAQERQQRLDVEPLIHYHQLGEAQR